MMIMDGPRASKINEYEEVMELINHVFRLSRGEEATMEKEFPLLLNRKNYRNMRIIREDGQVVSDVNFLINQLYIDSSTINYASIGAVCTREKYEKQGYSSIILDDVENQMNIENVDICLISGNRSLYTRRDAVILKSFKCYDIKPLLQELDFTIMEYSSEYLNQLSHLYNHKSTRFKRDLVDFEKLIDGSTHSWGTFSYIRKVLKIKGQVIGYIVVRVIDDAINRSGLVIESVGSPDIIYKTIRHLAYENKLQSIKYHVHVKDILNQLDLYEKSRLDNQQGTIKIINYKSFMENLKPYFRMYLSDDILSMLSFRSDDGYSISINDESIHTSSLVEMTKLIFDVDGSSYFDFTNKEKLKEIVDLLFPLEVPWTMNLNYQ